MQSNMKLIGLSNRLGAAASYIKQGAAVADIGTDHGYIPVYLAQRNIARRIIAADVKSGPLTRARLSAEEYGVGDRIEFILTDGLEGLQDQGLDTIVIAGMGGETIAGILERAPWTKASGVRLILQPQSKLNALLPFLTKAGYVIGDASLVLEDGRIYTVFVACAGENDEPGEFLSILLQKRDPLLPDYLEALIIQARRVAAGLEQSSRGSEDALAIKKRELDALLVMKEETDRWRQ